MAKAKPNTILLTGAAGFIGSHVAEALLARGARVIGVDNFNNFYNPAWKRANVEAVHKSGGNFEIEELDITDGPAVRAIVRHVRPAAVIHLAAYAGVRPSIEKPSLYAQVNVEGTAHLLQSAVEHKVSKFIFASSSSVYGNRSKVPFSEEDPVEEPISPYAATKRAGELLAWTYWHLYKLPISCLRFFTVYGPRQRPDLAIQKFTRLIDAGKAIPVYGDGSTSRDYTYIDDIVAGVLSALDKCEKYRIYNLGGSDPVTLSALIGEIESSLGKKAVIERKPMQPGDVERTYADLSRSSAELGFKPKTDLKQGLAKFVGWFREYKSTYR